jgi:hypothetical protein
MCAVSPVVHTSNISSYQKNLIFPVAVNNSIKVGPLVFLLLIFVIAENNLKRPVLWRVCCTNLVLQIVRICPVCRQKRLSAEFCMNTGSRSAVTLALVCKDHAMTIAYA